MSKGIERIKTVISVGVFLAMFFLIGKFIIMAITYSSFSYDHDYQIPLTIVAVSIAGLAILFALKKLL